MSGLSTQQAAVTIDDTYGTTARTAPTLPIKVAVETTAGTASAAGTELASTTRGSVTYGAATGTPPVASSSVQVSITAGANGTVVGQSHYDSAGTPVRKTWGPLATSRTVVAGDTIVFGIASLTYSITS